MSGFFWIASYPKSGNTWLRLALAALLHPDKALPSDANNGFAPNASQLYDLEEALDVESSDLSLAELEALRPTAYRMLAQQATRPLFRKVHDAWSRIPGGEPLFPPEVTLGTFYIVRDPRDVAVSWSHFAVQPLDAAVNSLCNPAGLLLGRPARARFNLPQRLSSWGGHVQSWLEAPGRPCCLLRYEDMLADPLGSLHRAALYAGIPHGQADLERAVAATDFVVLQQAEARHGFDGGQPKGVRFFRTGRAGGWRDCLTPQQVDLLAASQGAMMRRLGYLGADSLE